MDRAARHSQWEAAVRARLEQGDAMTCELRDAVPDEAMAPSFFAWLRTTQRIAIAIGTRPGPTGHLNFVWTLARREET